ncbi:hypothetical protein ACFU44_18160 [Nocardia rhizosphaerihabitans]|uniref:hypothetical protein n=1 Tax=Nocardia rhizosphaerihabitans TaxID=1691570 RepID=UPI00367305AB
MFSSTARMHRGRALAVEEGERVAAPHHVPRGIAHHPRSQRGDESAFGVGEIRCVVER